jgi:hypothetical protein
MWRDDFARKRRQSSALPKDYLKYQAASGK